MGIERSSVESELYQRTKHLRTFTGEVLERVVEGEPVGRDRQAGVDVAFPPEERDDLL
jgi:hypothetical protein